MKLLVWLALTSAVPPTTPSSMAKYAKLEAIRNTSEKEVSRKERKRERVEAQVS